MNDLSVTVVIPVYNAQRILAESIEKLHCFLESHCRYRFEIVIANNGSSDKTLEIAQILQEHFANVKVLHLAQKGRGGAVKKAWSQSQADILSYMDVDLSTDLNAFPLLIEPLINGENDLATGSRLLRSDLTKRGLRRSAISRCYNYLVRALFNTRFSDAQCGFKAITQAAAARLLPLVEDNWWFMDTELLVIAERLGFRIFDLPVRWVENPDSRVKILKTAFDDLKGLQRIRKNLASGKYMAAFRSTNEPNLARNEG